MLPMLMINVSVNSCVDSASMISQVPLTAINKFHLLYVAQVGFHTEFFKGGGGPSDTPHLPEV